MPNVTGLRQALDPYTEGPVPVLFTAPDGSTVQGLVQVADVDSVDEWRAAARLAARRNGWKVRTGMGNTHQQVFAARVDEEAERKWSGRS